MLDGLMKRLLGAIGGGALGLYLAAAYVLLANFPFSLFQGVTLGFLSGVILGVLGFLYPKRLGAFSFVLTVFQGEDMPLNHRESIFTGLSIIALIIGAICMGIGLLFRTQIIGLLGVLLTLGFLRIAFLNPSRLEDLD